jgi:hypothetical protein
MNKRMKRKVESFEFRVDDVRAVLEAMDRLGEDREGWINLHPQVPEEEDVPSQSPLGVLFSVSTHDVPVCTWVAGKVQKAGIAPDSLGVQHAAGTRTVAQLASIGVPVPSGWRTVQDHPRRGLVVLAPVGTAHSEELDWLLSAGTALSRVRLTGEWVAEVHTKG